MVSRSLNSVVNQVRRRSGTLVTDLIHQSSKIQVRRRIGKLVTELIHQPIKSICIVHNFEEYNITTIDVCIFVGLVKRDMLTLVGEIRCSWSDRFITIMRTHKRRRRERDNVSLIGTSARSFRRNRQLTSIRNSISLPSLLSITETKILMNIYKSRRENAQRETFWMIRYLSVKLLDAKVNIRWPSSRASAIIMAVFSVWKESKKNVKRRERERGRSIKISVAIFCSCAQPQTGGKLRNGDDDAGFWRTC